MNDKSSKYKLIAAGITLLLGLILAIGYPTGGVKANKITQRQVVHQTNHVSHTQSTNTNKAIVKKERPKKKRVIPVPPPSTNNEESQDEGC